MALWALEQNVGLDGWTGQGDAPKTAMTNGAPAVLKTGFYSKSKAE